LLCWEKKIRKLRVLKGYSQEYIADILKISQSAYSSIETNKSKLSIDRIKQISDILETNFLDLISSDKENIFFNSEKKNADFFEQERQNYEEKINELKDEINFLRNKVLKKL